jgi:hypothetical protein
VVVAMKAGHPREAEEVRRTLRPQDRLLFVDGGSAAQCTQAAAEAARGRVLLITENHTIPDAHCLDEALAFLKRSGLRAAFLRSEFINPNYFARQEGESYQKTLREKWLCPGEWRLVRLRGAVIERDLFFECGGLAWAYGLFAEDLLSLRLAQRGVPVGYADRAVIHHINFGHLRGLMVDITDHVEGDCAFRDREADAASLAYLGEHDVEHLRTAALRGMPAQLFHGLLRTAVGEVRSSPARGLWFALRSVPTLARLGAAALCGRAARTFPVWFGMWWQRLLCFVWQSHPTRGVAAYEAMWFHAARYARIRYYHVHPLPPESCLPAGSDFTRAAPESLVGFHRQETYQGRPFRWTEPVAAVRLRLEPRDHLVALDTGTLRGEGFAFPFGIFVNGRQVPRATMTIVGGRLTFSLPAAWLGEGEQILVLAAEPLPAAKGERRRLALPVFDLTVVPREQGETSSTREAA